MSSTAGTSPRPEAAAHSASLFQTGWFVESLLTQTLIIHVIRTNKIPFLQSRSSGPLMVCPRDHGDRRRDAVHAAGTLSGLHRAATALLAAAGDDALLLTCCSRNGQDVAAAEKVDLTGINARDPFRERLKLASTLSVGIGICAFVQGPQKWDIALIRDFMLVIGPLSLVKTS